MYLFLSHMSELFSKSEILLDVSFLYLLLPIPAWPAEAAVQ